MAAADDVKTPKRSIRLLVNADLLRQAKALGLDLSGCLEVELARRVDHARREQLRSAMRNATDIWSAFRDRHGSAIDAFRRR
jgi:antitoxin CcdA